MRSRAALGSHPLHPAMVAIPIGAFTVAVVADIVDLVRGDATWAATARLALAVGIVGALLAAVLGFIDYFAMPMSVAGRRWATRHMVINLIGVVLFATSWWLRRGDVAAVPTSAVALNVIAFVGLGISGWIGGNMVYRHKMAVLEHADPEATAIGQRESA